jgi:hypothetical protein
MNDCHSFGSMDATLSLVETTSADEKENKQEKE